VTELFRMLARYNAWANRRLYDAIAPLSDDEWQADCGAFFRSLQGTLNHLVVADRIWLKRFTGEGEAPTRLDAIVAADRPALRVEREATDARLIAYVDALDDARVALTFTYTPITDPRPVTQPLAPALVHVFNHQTHHRGQAHALLTRLTGTAPAFDLIYFQRETGIGME
jgi:uncharacterized damage-inducible protein DinB